MDRLAEDLGPGLTAEVLQAHAARVLAAGDALKLEAGALRQRFGA